MRPELSHYRAQGLSMLDLGLSQRSQGLPVLGQLPALLELGVPQRLKDTPVPGEHRSQVGQIPVDHGEQVTCPASVPPRLTELDLHLKVRHALTNVVQFAHPHPSSLANSLPDLIFACLAPRPDFPSGIAERS